MHRFLMELAEFEHLRSTGIVTKDARFAGHSLGEYAALASCTSFMPLERLVELLFFRGAKMQSAVPRDSQGRSSYGMVAVDPSRVGNGKRSELEHPRDYIADTRLSAQASMTMLSTPWSNSSQTRRKNCSK
jgi:malonyl CoA-acyl carrier protein transacylase